MPQMGKLYLGDIDVTFMYMGEQCVYELVTEAGSASTVTFNFTDSSLASTIYVMNSNGTLITALTSAPYVYSAATGGSIKWSASTSNAGNYYKAEGSVAMMGNRTVNVNMMPYYTVTFNWVQPSTPGHAEVTTSQGSWYVSGATRYKSGTTGWYAYADGYETSSGTFTLVANTAITINLTPSGYDYKPLTFKILTAGTITWRATSTSETISYSTNRGTTWTNVTAGPSAQLGTFSAGQEVWVKGVNTTYEGDNFGGTAYFNLEGNLASLINGDSFSATTPSITTNRVFFNLFSGSNVVSATNMIIPFGSVPASGYAGMFKNCTAMTLVPGCRTSELSNGCYESMFEGCTSIRTALPLPTRTLAQGCYRNMFKGCTSLITVGGLSASTLQANCYYGMFSGCTSLSATPLTSASTMANSACTYMFAGCSSLTSINMPKATTLSQDCYRGMFAECTSLTTPPTLSATTLGVRCYAEMFRDCSNLTSVPTLSVTALTTGCYKSMFEGCTKITTAPALPATAMTEGCYAYMFAGCTSLTGAPTLNATSLNTRCYQGMFEVCRSLTTAPALPATTLAEECYSYMFYDCTALTSAPQLMATTLVDDCYEYMFYNCNRLTELWVYATTNAGVTANTNNWVSGITTSGTLHVPQGMSSTWPTGASRRPVNWTVSEPTVSYTETFYVYPSSQEWGNTPTFEVNGYGVYLYGDEMIGGKLYDVYKYTAPSGTVLSWSLYNVSLGQPQGGSLTLVGNNPTYITHKVQYAITSVTPSDAAIVLNNVATSSTIVDYSSAVTNVTWSVAKAGYTTQSGSIIVTANTNTAVTLTPAATYSYSITTTQSGCTVVINGVTKTSSSTAGGTYTYTSNTSSSFTYTVSKFNWETETGTISANQTKTVTLWGDYRIFVGPYVGLELSIGVSSDDSDIIGEITKELGGEDYDRWLCTVPYLALRPATIDFTQNGYSTESFTLNASTSIGDGAENVVTLQPVSTTGSVTFNVFPADATIKVNGTALPGNVYSGQIGTQFTYTAEHEGWETYTGSGTITSSAGTTYGVPMQLSMLTFEISEDATPGYIWWRHSSTSTAQNITYRKKGRNETSWGTWYTITSSSAQTTSNRISVNPYDKIQFSGGTLPASDSRNRRYFQTNADFKVYGNIASLLSGNVQYNTANSGSPGSYAFYGLFSGCTNLTSAENLVLPFPTLNSSYIYSYMFAGCTSLQYTPKIWATAYTAGYCCYYMFTNCTSLQSGPILYPSTRPANYACQYMFYNCSALNSMTVRFVSTLTATSAPTRYWLYGVASSGTFTSPSTWNTNSNGHLRPSGWTMGSIVPDWSKLNPWIT